MEPSFYTDVVYMKEIPGLPAQPTSREDWDRYYTEVLQHRLRVMRACMTSEEARALEVEKFRRCKKYAISTYWAIFEARPQLYEDGELGSDIIPFVAYPFQNAWFDWYDERLSSRGPQGDGLTPKSRDMGLSNSACAAVGYDWLVKKPFQARLLSRVEDLVDKAGDPDSLFWKIELGLRALPRYIWDAFAPSFDWKHHRKLAMFINPDNGNVLSGESTQANAGRGGRATVVILDEFAFMENGGAIWTGLRASTPHRIAISTVSTDNGLDMYHLHHGTNGYTKPPTIEIPWFAHPKHTQAWFDQEAQRDSEEGVRQEILMDYFANTGTWTYPQAQKFKVGQYPLIPGAGPLYVAIDDGLDDQFAIHWIQYVEKTGRHRVVESYQNNNRVTDFYGTLMTGVPRSDFSYNAEELRLMKWIWTLPPRTYVGDTHGYNREQTTGQAPFERLAENFGIHVFVDWEKRTGKDRRTALGSILGQMDFNDTPGVQESLYALQRNHFPKERKGKGRQTAAKEPVHDDTSHAVAAFEYYAQGWSVFKDMHNGGLIVYDGPPGIG